LNDITAGDMMTPKSFVHFLDGAKTLGEIAEYVKSARHSRMPVFEGDKNTIVGMAHQRDLLKAITDGEVERPVKAYVRDALLVPDTLLADELLRKFQERRTHLAVVISEYGNVVGVVGLEDVLEELVGEIIEEKDVAPELIKRIAKNEILVHGQTRIPNINHFFNTEVKSKKTVNGFLLDKFGRLPEAGERLEYDGLMIIVEESNPQSIEKVRIIKKEISSS
jgi:putative hemolysin